MFLNTWAKRIHENAVAHGWWEKERSFAEVVSLFHSEVSEALEEYRAKRPMMYYPCNAGGVCVLEQPERNMDCGSRIIDTEGGKICKAKSDKPEGIAVELVDCVIRILDFFGHEGIADATLKDAEGVDIDGMIESGEDWCAGLNMKADLPEVVANLHYLISLSYDAHLNADNAPAETAVYERNGYLCAVVEYIRTWLADNGYNMEEIVLIKHEYNRTRSYRHGGKAL